MIIIGMPAEQQQHRRYNTDDKAQGLIRRYEVERLEVKRIEVLEAIKPICEAFKIEDYDYEVSATGQREVLRIKETRIGCSCNSIRAVVDELVGYIFIARWKDRNMGAFGKQTRNVIRQYWIKEGKR